MLKKAKELFFKFRTRHFKFIECRKSLSFDKSGYYPYQIMEIGESFLIDNVNVETIQKKHETINKELSKIFLAKIEADAVRITRIE